MISQQPRKNLPDRGEITSGANLSLARHGFNPDLRHGLETMPIGKTGLMFAIQSTANGSNVFLFADRSKNPQVLLPSFPEINKLIHSCLGARRSLGMSEPSGPINIDNRHVYLDEKKSVYTGKTSSGPVSNRPGLNISYYESTRMKDTIPTLGVHLYGNGPCNWQEIGDVIRRDMRENRPDLHKRVESGMLKFVPDTGRIY